MIIILLYWLFLFLFLLPAGLLLQKTISLKVSNISITLILGMFFQTLIFTILSFFFSLNYSVLLLCVAFNISIGYYFKREIYDNIRKAQNDFILLSKTSKAVLVLLALGALLKSAQLPFIIDNESYYVQTIKWLNEYGLVKGLGNLHIFFAQTSPWHILQAGINFNFFTDRINDINGFLFIACCFYYLSVFENYKAQTSKFHWIGFIILFSVLFFQFLDTPSPDLPVFLIVPVIIYLFTDKNRGSDTFKIITILLLFICFIKITIAPLLLFLLPFILKQRKNLVIAILYALPIGLIWTAKNIIITGYPLYPFGFLETNLDWKIPENLLNYIAELTKNYGYFKGNSFSGNKNVLEKLSHWIQLGGIAGIFNKLVIVLFLIMPLFKKIRHNKHYLFVYAVLLIHFILLLFTSPQFRFFIPQILFMSVFILSEFINFKKKGYVVNIILLGSAFSGFIFLIPINTKNLTSNKLHAQTSGFKISQLLYPEKNSRFHKINFVERQEGNLQYYSPETNFFFYGTANGPLPCVNEIQVNNLKKHLKIVPQLRKDKLKDGFYSENITD